MGVGGFQGWEGVLARPLGQAEDKLVDRETEKIEAMEAMALQRADLWCSWGLEPVPLGPVPERPSRRAIPSPKVALILIPLVWLPVR